MCSAVELLIFSGTPNPVFHLNTTAAEALCAAVQDESRNPTASTPSCRVLGFTGWKLADGSVWRGVSSIDRLLTELPAFQSLSTEVVEHVRSEIEHPVPCAAMPADVPPSVEASCKTVPILGPDDPSKVHYAPSTDDGGCFVAEQNKNNCCMPKRLEPVSNCLCGGNRCVSQKGWARTEQ